MGKNYNPDYVKSLVGTTNAIRQHFMEVNGIQRLNGRSMMGSLVVTEQLGVSSTPTEIARVGLSIRRISDFAILHAMNIRPKSRLDKETLDVVTSDGGDLASMTFRDSLGGKMTVFAAQAPDLEPAVNYGDDETYDSFTALAKMLQGAFDDGERMLSIQFSDPSHDRTEGKILPFKNAS